MIATPSFLKGSDTKVIKIFSDYLREVTNKAEKLFAVLFIFQWIMGIVFALVISPKTWSGEYGQTHIHVYAAVFLGGIIAAFPLFMIYLHPGRPLTRHIIAVSQILVSALMIHLTGGRIETHFHVFGSLAFLAFFRDWRVIITATVVTALDHLLRGVFWPQSVYGVLSATPWRSLEHAAWVIFEDIVLLYSIRMALHEAARVAEKESLLTTAQGQTDLLLRITAIANESRHLNEAIEGTLINICQYLSWPVGHAYFLSEKDPNLLIPSQLWYLQDAEVFNVFRELTDKTPLKIGEGLPGRVLQAKNAIWISDIMEDENFPRNRTAHDLGVHSAFAFPIMVHDKTIAVLEFFSSKITEKNESLLKIIENSGRQLGQVYERERAENEIRNLNQTLEDRVFSRTKELIETQARAEATTIQFSAIFDNAGVGILALDSNNNVSLANPAILRMLGYTLDELLHKNVFELTHPDDLVSSKNNHDQTAKGGHFYQNKRYLKKDGTYLWTRLSAAMLSGSNRNISAFGIIQDITEQKESEELVREQQLKIQVAAIETAHTTGMSEIATGVLHNVGNVLNSANVGLETIVQQFDKSVVGDFYKANALLKENRNRLVEFFTSDPKGEKLINFYFELEEAIKNEFTGQKHEANELMKRLQLIKDIINTQQMYAKGSAEFKENISLIEVVENALVMQASALTRHEVKVVKRFSAVPPILSQRSKLIHMVLNLIKNAKESMGAKDTREKVLTLEIGKTDRGGIFFRVTDTGMGIAKENLSKVFSHGFTTKQTGHGFGLHFCANSATEMGAKISVSSEGIGLGASFTIEFGQKNETAIAA